METQDKIEVQDQGVQSTDVDNEQSGNDQAMTEDDIYNLSPEDFEKEFDSLGEFNLNDFEEQTSENTDVEEEEEKLEQPENKEEETTDKNQTSEADDNMDSNKEITDEKDSKKDDDNKSISDEEQTFTLDNIPMDEILPMKIKAAGGEVQATMGELIEGFKKGLGFTQKMQQVSQYKPHIAMMKEHGISIDDLNRFIDIKNGDNDAVASLMKELKIDALDLDEQAGDNYKPKQYAKSNEALDMDEVKQTIASDTVNVEKVQNHLNGLDDKFYAEVTANGQNLNNFYEDVKSGTFDKVKPVMDKIAFLDKTGKSQIELYQDAVAYLNSQIDTNSKDNKAMNEQVEKTNEKAKEKKESISKKQKQSDKKKVLGKPTSKATNNSDAGKTEADVWDMDPDQFDKDFEKIFGRSIVD